MWNMELRCLLCVFLAVTQRSARSEVQETIIRYIEKRILSLEDRLLKCEQDVQLSLHEVQELSHKLVSSLEKLSHYKVEVKGEMESVWTRLERAEWDIDYLESMSCSETRVEIDDQLMEKQLLEQANEKRRERLKLSTSCSLMLAQIKSLKTVKKSGGAIGAWMKNTGGHSDSIYYLTPSSDRTLLEFSTMDEFTGRDFLQPGKAITLPFSWQGTGLQVYKNEVFFHRNGTTNEIVRYNFQKNRTQSLYLDDVGSGPPYQLSPHTRIDLAVDEQGLWAIYVRADSDHNLVLTKIDQADMAVTHAWNTTCTSDNAEAAFVICGTLYVMYNSPNGGRSHIDCIFDTSDVIDGHEMPTLYFPKRYSSHSSVHYNPRDHMLYAWDDGYQVIYRFQATKKEENF